MTRKIAKKPKYVSSRIEEDTLRIIEKMAADEERSISSVVRRLVIQGLAAEPAQRES